MKHNNTKIKKSSSSIDLYSKNKSNKSHPLHLPLSQESLQIQNQLEG